MQYHACYKFISEKQYQCSKYNKKNVSLPNETLEVHNKHNQVPKKLSLGN